MKTITKLPVRMLFIFLMLLLPASICSAQEIKTDNYTITTESVASPGFARVTIKSDTSDTLIQIDSVTVGLSPWNGTLTPGNHLVTLSAPDHYSLQFLFACQENAKYTISCKLDPFTGYLDIMTTPEDAMVYMDGAKINGRFLEVPVGYHTISAQKFGFEEKSLKILVLRGKASRVDLSLVPASFNIKDVRIGRKVFNPDNRGLFGRTTLAFNVTGPGYGRVEIRDSAGSLIFQRTLLPFTTWAQSFSWNGETETGPAPDGTYAMRLLLWPEKKQDPSGLQPVPAFNDIKQIEASEQASIMQEFSFQIDRNQRIIPAGYSRGQPGLSFVSNPAIQELPVFGLDFGGIITDATAGFDLAGAIRFGKGVVAGFASTIYGSGDFEAAVSLSGAVMKANLADASLAARLGMLDFSNSGGVISNFFDLTVPVALKAGAWRFGLEPGIRYIFDDSSIAVQSGAGVWYQSPSLFAGLSAHQTFTSGGIASSTNPLGLALEATYMLNRVPLTLGIRLSAEMTPSVENPQAWIGMGIVF